MRSASRKKKKDDWFACPVCGAEVPLRALACPECGSDERTGWSEDTIYDGIDLPDEAFGEDTGEEDLPPRSPGGGGATLFRSRALFLLALLMALVLFLLFLLR